MSAGHAVSVATGLTIARVVTEASAATALEDVADRRLVATRDAAAAVPTTATLTTAALVSFAKAGALSATRRATLSVIALKRAADARVSDATTIATGTTTAGDPLRAAGHRTIDAEAGTTWATE